MAKLVPFIPVFIVAIVFSSIFGHGAHLPLIFLILGVVLVLHTVKTFGRRNVAMSAPNSVAGYSAGGTPFSVTEAASAFTRGILSLLSGLLLFISLLTTLALVANLPGLAQVGALHPQLPNRMQEVTGTADWPQIAEKLGVAIAVVTGLASIGLMLVARRVGGPGHMLRGVIGILVLFAAVLNLGQALPNPNDVLVGVHWTQTMNWYFQHVQVSRAIWAAGIYVFGAFLLAWPRCQRRHVPIFVAPPPSPESTPAPAAEQR